MATSSNIHSNAFNFLSFIENGVDPRTGQYTSSLSLPKLSGNDLAGPEFPLRLVYNPLNTLDSGYGKGWSLQLSQYDSNSKMVFLSGGESFMVTSTSSDSDQLLMKEKKIDSFHLHKPGEERYQIVHKSGLVEDLQRIGSGSLAMPVKMHGASGHHLNLKYTVFNGQPLLESVANADGSLLLSLKRLSSKIEIRLHPGQGDAEALFSLVLQGSDNRVARIELPTSNLASWRFDYQIHEELLCISKVEDPLGGSEEIFYDGGSHLFPLPSTRRLPRVARHLHNPGSGQPVIDTRYDYSGENFLGRNAPGLEWSDTGEDNLYQTVSDYTYQSVEKLWDNASDSARRSITRTFNRFHLITEEATQQGDCIKRVLTDYYILDGKTFEEQPNYFQLPETVTTAWHRESEQGHERRDVVRTAYDLHGNQTLRVEADGVSEASEYYLATGEEGCPADPYGFVRHLKQRTTTPAKADYGDAPVLRCEFRYALQQPVSGGSQPWLAQVEETLFQDADDIELQKIVTHYFNQPGDSLVHGRTSVTETFVGGVLTSTDFFYSKPTNRRTGEKVLRTVEKLSSSLDKSTKTITREHSLTSGEPVLDLDDNDVEIAYVYDKLGRVVEEIVAPDSDVQAKRSFEYILAAQTGSSASQIVTDVKQVRIRSHVDGLQRVVKEERQDVGKAFRTIHTAQYDAFQQLEHSSEIDWLYDEEMILTSHYTWDDWGEQDSVTGPDGVTSHTLNDPVKREVQTWRDGEGRTITRSNLFDKPDSIERQDLGGKTYSKEEYFYDGLGRTHHTFDRMQNLHFYEYDGHDRMTVRGLPDGTRIERRYASHSCKDLPVWIGADKQVLGEQGFDGLGRRTFLEVGSYRESYAYEGGRMSPETRTTPAGDTITYIYTPQLTREPVGLVASDEQATFTYDRYDARLTAAQNKQGRREFEYDSTNHLSLERWIENGTTWTSTYEHSRTGRQLHHKDANGVESTSEYDDVGRLDLVSQGAITLKYSYDSLSRPYCTTCRDLDAGTELVTTLGFDDWGRETSRTLQASGQPARSLTQTYRKDDRLQSRHLQSEGKTLLQETFDYDERGRLTSHLCTGTQLPVDRYGNAIVEQTFTFDPLDNLRQVHTRFADGSDDTCIRTFADGSDANAKPGATNLNPCQLIKLTHSHADYPDSLELSYDQNGNLRFDENGQELLYDTQSRLVQVKDSGGQVVARYHYDAHDMLCGEVHGSAAQTRRFHQGDRLDCSVQDNTRFSYLHDEARPVAQQQVGAAAGNLLLLTSANNSVIGESQGQTLREVSYSAYGEPGNQAMQCPLGFNGELRDRSTGWYLLGNGYRAYNPYLMCFHSLDSLSPFKEGWINPYTYCVGDPINFSDPTGHFLKLPKWATVGLTIFGMVAGAVSFGLMVPGLLAAGGLFTGFLGVGISAKISVLTSVSAIAEGFLYFSVPDVTTKKWFVIGSAVTGALSLYTAAHSLKKYGWLGKNGRKSNSYTLPPPSTYEGATHVPTGTYTRKSSFSLSPVDDMPKTPRNSLGNTDTPVDELSMTSTPEAPGIPTVENPGSMKVQTSLTNNARQPVPTDSPSLNGETARGVRTTI